MSTFQKNPWGKSILFGVYLVIIINYIISYIMKYFYISVILFIINHFADMSQISFSFIRHVTTVLVLFRKKKYFSLKALK